MHAGRIFTRKGEKFIHFLMFTQLSEKVWWPGQHGLIKISIHAKPKFSFELHHQRISGNEFASWNIMCTFLWLIRVHETVNTSTLSILLHDLYLCGDVHQLVHIVMIFWVHSSLICNSSLNSGGEWKSSRSCIGATEPLPKPSGMANKKDVVLEEVVKQMKTPVTLLNITSLSEYRIDAHPSAIKDCSHWCLPGVPDAWNELLYLHFLSDKWPKYTEYIWSLCHTITKNKSHFGHLEMRVKISWLYMFLWEVKRAHFKNWKLKWLSNELIKVKAWKLDNGSKRLQVWEEQSVITNFTNIHQEICVMKAHNEIECFGKK